MVEDDDKLVSGHELSVITGISSSTWAKRRLTGDSPPYIKIGRSVRYSLAVVRAWLQKQTRNSTQEAA